MELKEARTLAQKAAEEHWGMDNTVMLSSEFNQVEGYWLFFKGNEFEETQGRIPKNASLCVTPNGQVLLTDQLQPNSSEALDYLTSFVRRFSEEQP